MIKRDYYNSNNNDKEKNNHCIFQQKERCRIFDEHSGAKLPLHAIPGTDSYICEDHYLADKINRWWYKTPRPENKPQFQDLPGRIRPSGSFWNMQLILPLK